MYSYYGSEVGRQVNSSIDPSGLEAGIWFRPSVHEKNQKLRSRYGM